MNQPTLRTQREPRASGVGSVLLLDGSGRAIAPSALPHIVPRGTLWVLNDAATLPAAFWVRRADARGAGDTLRFELRVAQLEHRQTQSPRFTAVALGAGSFREQTEVRGPPPNLSPGDLLRFAVAPPTTRQADFARGTYFPAPAVGLARQRQTRPLLRVVGSRGRLLELEVMGSYAGLLRALYALGAPIQYSYSSRPYTLGEVQNAYAGRPWAIEPASAGRHLSTDTLNALREAGHEIAWLTHAAGISSTGDPVLDAQLPFPEGYDIPEQTARAVERAKRAARLVIAVGSSTTRALESSLTPSQHDSANQVRLAHGAGVARLRLSPESKLGVVDGLLTGIHEAGSSHRELTRAFASEQELDSAWQAAGAHGLLLHEFGDAMLMLAPHHGYRAVWRRHAARAARAA